MTTQPEELAYEVRIFGYGNSDIGCDGPNFYPYVARRFYRATQQDAIDRAASLLKQAFRDREADGCCWGPESEWVGAAVYCGGKILWQSGATCTDDEIEQAWL